jgi:uncharacterized membrane protein (DUF485 family)
MNRYRHEKYKNQKSLKTTCITSHWRKIFIYKHIKSHPILWKLTVVPVCILVNGACILTPTSRTTFTVTSSYIYIQKFTLTCAEYIYILLSFNSQLLPLPPYTQKITWTLDFFFDLLNMHYLLINIFVRFLHLNFKFNLILNLLALIV